MTINANSMRTTLWILWQRKMTNICPLLIKANDKLLKLKLLLWIVNCIWGSLKIWNVNDLEPSFFWNLNFILKIQPTHIEFLNQSKNIPVCQNLRPIGLPRVPELCMIWHTNRDYNFKYVDILYKTIHMNLLDDEIDH